VKISLKVNDEDVALDIEPRITLADCLRNHLQFTGTHVGCAHGVCGACTVLVEKSAVRSCLMLAVQANGKRIQTVEGLSGPDQLGPLQTAFRKHHALQCGFCTPGMLMTLHSLLSNEPFASAERIRDVLGGNLCRCTGYIGIVEAALEAQASYQTEQGQDLSRHAK
jgi:aerobic carbon-monoxide dehydrogenase small subunit